MVNRGVDTEEQMTEVQSRGSREVSGSGSSQTLADQDVEMGRVEVGKLMEEGGEKEEGTKMSHNLLLFIF
jgi:hypothetical protein